MTDKKIDSYTINPRSIVSDYRNGKLSIPERNLLFWLRANGSPYGIANVDLELLSKETFNTKVDKSYINKLMLSLKSKRYIWYQERRGRRGSFEVHLDFWVLPDKSIRRLDKYFSGTSDIGGVVDEPLELEEVEAIVNGVSQKFKFPKNMDKHGNSLKQVGSLVRGYDTDNDIYKEKDNDLGSVHLRKEDFRVGGFVPRTAEEQRCLEIALEVGDESIGFLIGIYRKYGLRPLENALLEFREIDENTIENKARYYNSLVQKHI